MITYTNDNPRRCSVTFDGSNPEWDVRMAQMVAEIHAFAALSPAEQQAQIAMWPPKDQQLENLLEYPIEDQREVQPEAMPKAA